MNLLAHAYLSFNNPGLLVGNMISDFVKGRTKFDYSEEIQKGIRLHRAIDTFTDDHPITKEAKKFLKDAAGLYSGPFIDIVYDHFLALEIIRISEEDLREFSKRTYKVLQQHQQILPPRFLQMLPYMIEQNWLFNYKNLSGIERSFEGLARRAKFLDNSVAVYQSFRLHYSSLQKCYNDFFPLLKQFATQYVQAL